MRARRSHRTGRPGRPGRGRYFLIAALGVGLTLASTFVKQPGTARYGDIESCLAGCQVAAAGWPLPYILDYPGMSPANSASLAGAMLGLDRWRPEALAIDLFAWTVAVAVTVVLLKRPVRR